MRQKEVAQIIKMHEQGLKRLIIAERLGVSPQRVDNTVVYHVRRKRKKAGV